MLQYLKGKVMRGARSKWWTVGSSVAFLVFANGCVAESCETETGEEATCLEVPTRYEDDASARTLTEVYFPGMNLAVDGIYGEIRVFEGVGGRVSARFLPFAYGSREDEALAFERLQSVPRMDVSADTDTLTVLSERTDDELPLVGMDLEIGLPPEFEGELFVKNRSAGSWNPGDVDLDFVAGASSVELEAGKVSSCSISGSPSVLYTYVRCWSDIHVAFVNDDVDIVSQGQLGDVSVQLDSISFESRGGSVSAGGNVEVSFPASANFTIQAQAEAPGIVDTTAAPRACSIATAAETAKSLTCGAGDVLPNYLLESGDNVILDFE